jgi:hypothetical protein
MSSEKATLLVHCRFPTGAGNRVRVLVDGAVAGELRRPLEISPGKHRVRVTSWGLPLCGPLGVNCPPGVTVELSLQVWLAGFLVGLVLFLGALVGLVSLLAALGQRLAGYEFLVIPAMLAGVVGTCLLDFYVVLPALSLYTFRLVREGR